MWSWEVVARQFRLGAVKRPPQIFYSLFKAQEARSQGELPLCLPVEGLKDCMISLPLGEDVLD
jgi:hypothetical protein